MYVEINPTKTTKIDVVIIMLLFNKHPTTSSGSQYSPKLL